MLDARDLHNLEAYMALLAIMRCAGKKKAAEEQCISVETLNKQIKWLEKSFGHKLVCGQGKKCALTYAGQMVVDSMHEVSEIWDQFEIEKENRNDISGLVKVGIDVSVAPTIVPVTMAGFFEEHSSLGLEMISMLDIEKDSIDCDICIAREPICHANDFALIYKRKMQCGYFASSQYLSKHGYPINLNDMADNHRLVLRRNTKIYDDDFKQVLVRSPNMNMISSNSASIVDLVRNGAGIGIMPLRFKDEGLVCLDNLVCKTQIMYYLMAKTRIKDVPRVRLILDFYKEALADMK